MSMPSVIDAVWRAVIEELLQRRVVQHTGHWLHLPEHCISLNDHDRELAQRLLSALLAGRFDPPWVRELAVAVQSSDEEIRQVLRKCALQGSVYQIVHDLFYHSERVRELARVLRDLVHRQGVVEAAHYRDAIGVGRKRAIQILEFFDRVGYTRRTRNARVLRVDSSWHDED